MTALIGLYAAALLSHCPIEAEGMTHWGTCYIIDSARVTKAMIAEKKCLEVALNSNNRDTMRDIVMDCDRAEYKTITTNGVYYFYTGQQEDGASPFEEFNVCTFSLSSPMWDFPDDYDAEQFRDSIRNCLSSFPSL